MFLVAGLGNHTSHSLPNSPPVSSGNQDRNSLEPPLPPRGIKKPPAALSMSGGGMLGRPLHGRNTSDPETEIQYVLHRRTPSEPPPRPQPLDARYTINIPYSDGKGREMVMNHLVLNAST